MELSQAAFEEQLIGLLLEGDHPVLATLRLQYAGAKIARREYSGVGFCVDFEVPDSVPLANPPEFAAGNISIDLEGLQSGAGCVLFVRNGKLATLECFTYLEPWPERIVVRSFSNVRPAIPG